MYDPTNHDSNPDLHWIDTVKKENKVKTDKLEMELKGYKNNLIKESIRVCLIRLGFSERSTD